MLNALAAIFGAVLVVFYYRKKFEFEDENLRMDEGDHINAEPNRPNQRYAEMSQVKG